MISRRVVIAMSLVLLAGLLVAGGLLAQDVSPELQQQIDELEAYTQKQRGLDAVTPITRAFPSRADLLEYLLDVLNRDLTEEDLWRETQFYVAFDFLTPDINLYQEYFDLYAVQIAGFYDLETETMNVIMISGRELGDRLPLTEQIIYVHEYVHALQDQHFDMESLGMGYETDFVNVDQQRAIVSLIEGDATLVMNDFTIEATQDNPVGAMLEILLQGARTGTLTLPPSTPDIIAAELTSPYFEGVVFVRTLYQNGGWARVNAAYTDNPPRSTEHILHPQSYLNGDMPIAVTLQPVDAVLGEDWDLILSRTFGEFYLREYLAIQLPAPQAIAGAAGWGGDTFALYHQPETDQLAWVMGIVWDSEAEAAEFAVLYDTFLATRLPDGIATGDCLAGEVDALCTITTGDTTFISYGPDADIAARLLATQQ